MQKPEAPFRAQKLARNTDLEDLVSKKLPNSFPVNGACCLEISIPITNMKYHVIQTDRHMNSFFPYSTQSWNNIDINFQSSPFRYF